MAERLFAVSRQPRISVSRLYGLGVFLDLFPKAHQSANSCHLGLAGDTAVTYVRCLTNVLRTHNSVLTLGLQRSGDAKSARDRLKETGEYYPIGSVGAFPNPPLSRMRLGHEYPSAAFVSEGHSQPERARQLARADLARDARAMARLRRGGLLYIAARMIRSKGTPDAQAAMCAYL